MRIKTNEAREICNIVRKHFPYESPWIQHKIIYQNIIKNTDRTSLDKDVISFHQKISHNKQKLDSLRNSYQNLTEEPVKYFRELVKALQKYKVQNCAESARLGYLASRINGVKDSDVTIGFLTTQIPYDEEDYSDEAFFPLIDKILFPLFKIEYGENINVIDHVVTLIKNHRKKQIIIDPLLNEVGNIKQVEKIYISKYGKELGIEEDEQVNVIDSELSFFPKCPKINDEDAKELGREFEFLVLDKNKDKINNKKKHFFNFLER